MIKLIVDSTCDLNSSITDNYDIEVIPLSIIIGGNCYLDGVEIDTDTVYKHMRSGKVPTTAQVSHESVSRAFDKCISNGDDFIYLAFSSEMSGTYSFAKMILDDYKEKYPERKMEIIDSKGGCGGSSITAIQALKMIEKGLPYEIITEQIKNMVEHTVYYFTISDLLWAAKGGRISKPLGYVGSKLHIKPFLTVDNGKMVVTKLVRGSKRVYDTLLGSVQSGTSRFKKQIIGISHSDDLEAALKLETKIKETVEGCKTTIFQIGAVLGTHIGIGGVGVFFFDEEPEFYEFA